MRNEEIEARIQKLDPKNLIENNIINYFKVIKDYDAEDKASQGIYGIHFLDELNLDKVAEFASKRINCDYQMIIYDLKQLAAQEHFKDYNYNTVYFKEQLYSWSLQKNQLYSKYDLKPLIANIKENPDLPISDCISKFFKEHYNLDASIETTKNPLAWLEYEENNLVLRSKTDKETFNLDKIKVFLKVYLTEELYQKANINFTNIYGSTALDLSKTYREYISDYQEELNNAVKKLKAFGINDNDCNSYIYFKVDKNSPSLNHDVITMNKFEIGEEGNYKYFVISKEDLKNEVEFYNALKASHAVFYDSATSLEKKEESKNLIAELDRPSKVVDVFEHEHVDKNNITAVVDNQEFNLDELAKYLISKKQNKVSISYKWKTSEGILDLPTTRITKLTDYYNAEDNVKSSLQKSLNCFAVLISARPFGFNVASTASLLCKVKLDIHKIYVNPYIKNTNKNILIKLPVNESITNLAKSVKDAKFLPNIQAWSFKKENLKEEHQDLIKYPCFKSTKDCLNNCAITNNEKEKLFKFLTPASVVKAKQIKR